MTPGQRLRLFGATRFGTGKGAITTFAKALGMKPSNLHKYLANEREPGTAVLARISELGCNIHWLVSGEGEMFANNALGEELRRKAGNPVISEPDILASYPTFREGKQLLGLEIDRLKRDLETAPQGTREGILERLNYLLEAKAEYLQQENLVQRGQIIAYEKMLGTMKEGEVKEG